MLETLVSNKKGNKMSLGMYGDGGSMKGSGIDSESWTGEIYCSTCDEDVEVDGSTDDWGTMVYATCPDCNSDLEKEIDNSRDDDDYAYESWRDSQLD